MYALKVLFVIALAGLYHHYFASAEPLLTLDRVSGSGSSSRTTEELNTCEQQLAKYRKFLLQAIISFEDVCDAYNARPSEAVFNTDSGILAPAFFRNYQPPQQRSEIWAFFKLLMAQFNDLEFTNVIRDAVIERCHIKSMQRDEKRNSVVLGKKQRFHSWGGKRSSLLNGQSNSEEHTNNERNYFI